MSAFDGCGCPVMNSNFETAGIFFGVIFVARPEDAARELACVCKNGGWLGICPWPEILKVRRLDRFESHLR